MNTQVHDSSLFVRWRDGGDQGALAVLEARLKANGALWQICRRLAEGLRHHDAEDIWQQGWWRATRYAASFHGPPERFRPWFAQILRRAFCDLHERQRTRPETHADNPEQTPTPHTCGQKRADIRNDVQRALDTLPPQRADIVRLYLQGTPHAQIAQKHGISLANCRQQTRRALLQIRDTLGEWRQELRP